MKLPNVIAGLVAAQNNSDSQAYANCFTETAVVLDEGKTHTGKTAIKNWIEQANETYKTAMKPLEFSISDQTLTAEISGSFPGSPIVLTYQFELKGEQIQSLKIG